MSGNETHALSLSDSLGPRMVPFVTACYDAAPHRFLWIWITGTIAMVIGLVIACGHRSEMARRPPSMLKVYYNWVNVFAPVLGVCACFSLYCPRNYLMMKVIQEQAEAIALMSFGNILFLLCAEQASKKCASVPDLEKESFGVKMLSTLNEQGPQPHFAAPPFACCFVKCMPKILLKANHIRLIRMFIKQYAFMIAAGSLLQLWCALSLTPEQAREVSHYIHKIRQLSAFVCIYGLFIFYKSMHHVLEKWNPTAKFISLKLVVVLMAYQEILVKLFVHKFEADSDACMLRGLDVDDELGREVALTTREHFTSMHLVTLESILVACLVRRAFPPSELKAKSSQIHGSLLELDFERLEHSEKLGAEALDEESSSDDEDDDDSVSNGK